MATITPYSSVSAVERPSQIHLSHDQTRWLRHAYGVPYWEKDTDVAIKPAANFFINYNRS